MEGVQRCLTPVMRPDPRGGPVQGAVFALVPGLVWWAGAVVAALHGLPPFMAWVLVLGWVVAGALLAVEVGLASLVDRRPRAERAQARSPSARAASRR